MAHAAKESPIVPSDEGDEKGLKLAKAQGEALTKTLKHMTEEIATDGREIQVGEYLVAYAVEEAEGMYMPKGGKLEWVYPEKENCHVEVSVRDAADGRFIPGLDVTVTVIGDDGKEHGTQKLPLLWHPYLYHYGRNFRVPADGTYKLRVRFDPPTFMRHDEKNGHRFLEGVDTTFEDVKIETGQD